MFDEVVDPTMGVVINFRRKRKARPVVLTRAAVIGKLAGKFTCTLETRRHELLRLSGVQLVMSAGSRAIGLDHRRFLVGQGA
ncbi:uncharacterized protein N7482_002186 [Penicillium canariense]|uniref:Uncharacterized protein n=1 Tax=Penicillium canariense TaxID=189055 RepID=A0A9W9IHC7_9EURO|nr:uncharacterized protein N7482_002186 [Penicillium canariense]KAJ5176309.1 hypothetical protein N7482_002186 [Penicillium canariense]